MPDNKNLEAFEKLLTANLGRVNELMRFAEAKNAALLTFSSAWILFVGGLYTKDAGSVSWIVLVGLLAFTVAAAISIISFLPKLKINIFHTEVARSKGLLFFGDIAMLDNIAFRQRVTVRYLASDDKLLTGEYLDDLCAQISVNSKIANSKFLKFNAGAWFALAGVLCTSTQYFPNLVK
jgi:hypothetical protein